MKHWTTVLILVALLLMTTLAFAVPGAPTAAKVAAAPNAPGAIPGYWLEQRLGTPDLGLLFVDADHGWARSQALPSALYRTGDGGLTWQVTSFGANFQPREVNDAFFINDREGWVTGEWDVSDISWNAMFIAHTTDGGATWQDQVSMGQSQQEPWVEGERIWFVDRTHGWVAAEGTLWRTTDGVSWTRLEPPDMPRTLLRFINRSTGFGVAEPWDGPHTLMRTTDAGDTWSALGPVPTWAKAVWISADGRVVWAAGDGGRLARSTDLAGSWTGAPSPTTRILSQLTFTDALHGWAAGDAGVVLHTADGGMSWELQEVGSGQAVTSLAAVGSAAAWTYAGSLHRTEDGGAHWSALRQVSSPELKTLRMSSTDAGWAGGSGGLAPGTSNGGRMWLDKVLDTSPILSVDTVDAAHVWALSSTTLHRSTDGGASWQSLAAPGDDPREIDFVSTTQGWLASGRSIYRTTDGGTTWQVQYTAGEAAPGLPFWMQRVDFVDTQHGWAVATQGYYLAPDRLVLRTTDGGAHWVPVGTFGCCSFNPDISFVDATHGWAIDGYLVPFEAPGRVMRTIDGGMNWEALHADEQYTAVDFLNSHEGWVVGTHGLILYTTDGGDTWRRYDLPSRVTLRAVHAVAPGNAWFAGDGGLIMHYSLAEPPGCWSTPTPAPTYGGVPPAQATVERRVAHCVDDTYVRVDTEELLFDRDYVRMGARDGGAVAYTDGFLFRDVRIPQGARITSARLRLTAEGHQSGAPVVVSLTGEDHGQAGDFSPTNWWAHLRPRTDARVPWTINTTAAGTLDSPDIAAVVTEIVGRVDWRPGNNLAILVDSAAGGAQFVNWWAYDAQPSQAAQLIVSYAAPAATFTPTPSSTPTQTDTPEPSLTSTPTNTPVATHTPTGMPAPKRTYLPLLRR